MAKSLKESREEKRLKAKVNQYRLRTRKGFLSYCLNRVALNNPLQWVVTAVTFILLTIYLLIGVYDISGVWYDVRKNTDLLQHERNLVEIESLSVDSSGLASIKTKSGQVIQKEKVGYVFVDSKSDVKYYIASDNIIVSPIGVDFLSNYLLGTKFTFVLLYVLFFEGIRRALAMCESGVMSNVWVKMYSCLLVILYFAFLISLYLLFT